MSTLAVQAGRTADKIAIGSAILHLAVAVFGVWLAQEADPPTAYWVLAAFAALGLVATLLGWASVRAGVTVWTVGLAVLGLSVGLLTWALFDEGGLGAIACAIPMLFIDWLLFSNARKAFSGR